MLSPSDVNSTAFLLGMYGIMDKARPVLLDMFFKQEETFSTEEIYFDRVSRARNLAPFVVPTVAGKPMRSRGYKTTGMKPPYVKPKHIVEPIKSVKRRAGERLLGEMTPAQRFQLAILDNLFLEDESITRREEHMATQLLLTGAMTLSGPDFPSLTLDLGRNSANTIALTGAARWGQTGVDPLSNLQDWAAGVQALSGFHPSTVIMDPKAARLFTRSPSVLTVMNSFRQVTGNVDLAGKAVGGAPGSELKYLGDIGEFNVSVYQQLWADDDGVVHQFMPDYSVILGNEFGCSGVRCYGAIMDADALVPLKRFPKVWKEHDPSMFVSMTQSAPMPILAWPDATFAAIVG